MRVVWVLSGLAMGGGERNIVSVLPYLRDCGIEITLCTLNTRRDSPLAGVFSATGIPRHDLAARRMLDFSAFRRFSRLLADLQVDLIHAEDQDSIVYAGLARRLLHIPAIMTRHVLEEPSSTLKEAFRARLVLWSARFGVNRVIAVSEAVRLQLAGQAHIPLSKIETIYNGIDLGRFEPVEPRAAVRQRLGWDLDRPTAILVSVMRPGKGFEVLFDAIPIIRDALPDLRVKLVGDGPLQPELRKRAVELGLADTLQFLGQRMDIPDLLHASDLLIQASWSEALPTVLIEAGAAALPVVATGVGGSTEIVQDGKSGFIIPAGDPAALAACALSIFRTPGLASQMGSYAHDFVHHTFSLPRQAQQTVALYNDVLGETA